MPQVNPLEPAVVAAIEAEVPAVAALLGAEPDAVPGTLVRALEEYVTTSEEIPDNVVLGLGALLGSQYVRAFGWDWVTLDYGPQGTAYGVVSPDRAVGNQPMNWVYSVAHQGVPANFALNFALVSTGELPAPQADGPVMYT